MKRRKIIESNTERAVLQSKKVKENAQKRRNYPRITKKGEKLFGQFDLGTEVARGCRTYDFQKKASPKKQTVFQSVKAQRKTFRQNSKSHEQK